MPLPTRYRAALPLLALLPATATAAPWGLKPDATLPDVPGSVTQKLELADLDADGFVDIALANSAGDNIGNQSTAQLNQLLRNDGGAGFSELPGVFDEPDNAYAIKAGDLDGDGDLDLVVGVNFNGESYLLLNEGGGAFTREPLGDGGAHSLGDLELGDLDGDGDLDILAADWGTSQPYGDPDDPGAALRLWLGGGDGSFVDASARLPAGMDALAAWSFDLELVDLDNDYDLDAFVSSRGFGHALVLRNDGAGGFELHAVPALQPDGGKQVNTAFTAMELDGDEFLDLVTLQDGVGAAGNSVLINDGAGQFADNPGEFWPLADNPSMLDFDAATLDFDNSGTADLVVTGLRQDLLDNNSRLLLNSGSGLALALAPNDAAFPVVPQLANTFGLQFADFDRDGREDVALALRDALQPNFVLFGKSDEDGVPADTRPPRIAPHHELLPDTLFFGAEVTLRARVHDYKTPTTWHDWRFDDELSALNYVEGALIDTHRRLPYLEFALGLAAPEELEGLPDGDPLKRIVPALWYGESLWRVDLVAPFTGAAQDTLTWRYCAIDAAGNQACVGPFQAELSIDPAACGDGVVQAWEACDDALDEAPCAQCQLTCGDGTCDPEGETPSNCPDDCGECDADGACESEQGEDLETCPDDCTGDSICGDDACTGRETAENCPADCDSACGDGTCAPDEVCPADCEAEPTEGGVCGNGVCEVPGEGVDDCPADCVCGDFVCADDEVCPEDCDGATGESGPDTGGEDVPEGGCQCRGGASPDLLGLTVLLLLRRRRR